MSLNAFLLICILVFIIAYLKWVIIFLVFPFQVIYNSLLYKPNKSRLILLLMRPYYEWEILFRDGWERYMLFQVGIIPSCHIRKWIYKALGARIGKNVVFHFKTEIRNIGKLQIGRGCIIGDNAILDARNGLVLGANVNLSSNVSIYTLQHDHRDPDFGCNINHMNVVVGDRAWIGCNVVVLPGVKIGEGAVCCAGCVVTKDVEPYSVVAGIPAKEVNKRPQNMRYEFDGKSCRLY